jgi:hypothetical protein
MIGIQAAPVSNIISVEGSEPVKKSLPAHLFADKQIEPQLGHDITCDISFGLHGVCWTVYGTVKPTWFNQFVSLVGLYRLGLCRSAQRDHPHYVMS